MIKLSGISPQRFKRDFISLIDNKIRYLKSKKFNQGKINFFFIRQCLFFTYSNDYFIEFGSGLKRLLTNINPSLTQEQADAFTAAISEAAELFPDFCNSGDEKKDKAEFAAFLTIVGAETSFSVMAGFPCEIENGCPNCDAVRYLSHYKKKKKSIK